MPERSIRGAFDELIRQQVPTQTERDVAASHRSSVRAALDPLSIYGMTETGSFRHGTAIRGHSDVDVIAMMRGDRPTSADTALDRVRTRLASAFPLTSVRVNRPAVVVDFAGGAERWEVIPGYPLRVSGDHLVYAIPAPGGTWLETSPEAHLEYVTAQNKAPSGGAKSLARLVKAYKYFNFSAFKVSSFYLEMRAAKYMADETAFLSDIDFVRLLERLVAAELAPMNDPTGVTGRFSATSTDAYRAEALSRLKFDAKQAREALSLEAEGRRAEAFAKLDSVFVCEFPPRFY